MWHAIKEKNGIWYLNAFLAIVIIVVTTLLLLGLLDDADFFWHLKTGELIWQNKALPSFDPFSYTSPPTLSERARFILTSYWLTQLTYHLVHAAAGMYGIVFLRFLVFGAMTYVMIKRRRGDLTLYLALLLIFFTDFLLLYPQDRPQVFSFLFFGVLLLLLDRIRGGEPGPYWGLPLLMLIWGNVHGGHIVGQAVIMMYIVIEGLKFLRPSFLNPLTAKAYRNLLLAGAAGIACSLLNPNTYHAWIEMMKNPSDMTYSIIEYCSTIQAFTRFNNYNMVLYWLMLLLAFFGVLANFKKVDLTEVCLLAATGYFSFTQNRYIAFFLIAAVPVTTGMFSGDRLLRRVRPFIVTAAICIGILFSRGEYANIRNIGSGNWIDEYRFPVHAAQFIRSHNISGNMFNHYGWGGYLIWRLGPDRKVFTDGRSLYEEIFSQAVLVSAAHQETFAGSPFWKSVLAGYDVRYIVIPFYGRSGGMMPLVGALRRDKDWAPVYLDFNAVIFVKDCPENRELIAESKYSINREYFAESMLIILTDLIKARPDQIRFHIAKGDVYADLSRFNEARKEYEKAIRIAPFNAVAKARLRQFSALGR